MTPTSWVLCVAVVAGFATLNAVTDNHPLAPLALLAGLAAIAVVVLRTERERVAALVARADQHGWSHQPTAPDPELVPLPPVSDPGTVRDVLRGRWRGREVLAYERTHQTQADADDPDTAKQTHLAVVAVGAAPGTPFVVDPRPRRWLPPTPGVAPPSVFDVRWEVVEGHLDEALRRLLMAPDARGLRLRRTRTHVVAVGAPMPDPDRLEAVLDLLCDLAEAGDAPAR